MTARGGGRGGGTVPLRTVYDQAERARAPGRVLESEIVRVLYETASAQRLFGKC